MNALTVINPAPAPVFSMGDMERIALAIAKGGLFGSNDPNAVLTLCMLAQAENKHPALIMQNYHIISGKPAKKADAMLVDFLASGGRVEWHALTDDSADATFSHPAGGTVRINWDKARVAQAQLGNNPMHKKYPRQMLRARTISEGVRTVFPGATSGMYVPEEVQDFTPAASPTPPTPTPVRARQIERQPETPAVDTPPSTAATPPLNDAGQSTGAASNGGHKAEAWALGFIASVEVAPDRAFLADLQTNNDAALVKLKGNHPAFHERVTAAIAARLAELDANDASDGGDEA